MEYLIPAALVVLLVGAFVIFVSLYSVRKGGPGESDVNAGDSGDASPGMGADSATALGDTDQLSDTTEGGSEAESAASADSDDGGGGRFERSTPEDSDEDAKDTAPASERLADRGP